MSESNTAPVAPAADGRQGTEDGQGVVARRQFLPPATIHFDESIPEEELLIDWQRDPFVQVSGVSLVELRNVRVWSDIQSICVHDAVNGMHADLSLVEDGFTPADIPSEVPVERLEGTTALLLHLDPHNFYHWLIDTVPCFGVLDLSGCHRDDIDRFYIHRMDSGFQKRTLARLDIDESRVRCFDGHRRHYEFERLLVPLFRLDGAFWPNPWATSYLKDLYLDSDARAANDAMASSGARKLVYVRRGDARRTVINEAALESRLAELGFTVLAPETHSFEEQAKALANADGVLGSHGAGLANIAFCRPGTKVMEFGGHYITTHFRIVAQLANLRYRAIAVGIDERGERLPTSYDGDIRNLDFECDNEAVASAACAWFELGEPVE